MMQSSTADILCAGCGQVITLTRDMIEVAMACANCGSAIDYWAYDPLVPWLEELERRAALLREKERQEKSLAKARARMEKDAERRKRDAERQQREQAEANVRAAREHEKQRASARRAAEELQRERAARAGLRIGTTASMLIASFFILVAFALGLWGCSIFFFAESVLHEIAALLVFLLAAVVFSLAVIFGVIVDMAATLALKVDAVSDAVREQGPPRQPQG